MVAIDKNKVLGKELKNARPSWLVLSSILVVLAGATTMKAWEFPQRREVADTARGPLLLLATSLCFSSRRGLRRMYTFVVC
jgi:hypothetical protein